MCVSVSGRTNAKAEASAIRISAQLRRREARWHGRKRSNEKYNAGSLSQSSSACLGWTREVKTITGLPIDDTQSLALTVVTDSSTGSAGAVENTKSLFLRQVQALPHPTPQHDACFEKTVHAWLITVDKQQSHEGTSAFEKDQHVTPKKKTLLCCPSRPHIL